MRTSHRKMILMGILIFSAVFAGHAAAATLQWNASSGTVDGYKVYYGTSSSAPSSSVTVGNVTQYKIDSLPLSENTQYYFCVSAFNSAGESAMCAPVAYTPADSTPPAPPVGVSVE